MTDWKVVDWKDLAGKVITLGAPALGTALGGPLGGLAGKILADSLGGVEANPVAVGRAVEQARDIHERQLALQQAESEWLHAMAEIGKAQVSQVGETQRAEIVSDEPLQRLWRPLYALELSLLECPGIRRNDSLCSLARQ